MMGAPRAARDGSHASPGQIPSSKSQAPNPNVRGWDFGFGIRDFRSRAGTARLARHRWRARPGSEASARAQRAGAAAARRHRQPRWPVGWRRSGQRHRAGTSERREAAAQAGSGQAAAGARAARDRRPASVVHADGRAALDAVSVPLRAGHYRQRHVAAPVHHSRREHPQLPPDLHGWAQASGGARSDVVRPFDRPLGEQGHARHRHRRLQ